MSGQFEQRRLARPAYQLTVLDAFAGTSDAVREARAPGASSLRRARLHDELTRDAAAAQARLDGLRALVADTDGLEPGAEDELRNDRERLRHVTELAAGAAAAVASLAPDDGDGAADLVAAAERSIAPLERLAPELAAAGEALRAAELQLRETASDLHGFLASLEAEPDRVEASRPSSTLRRREAPLPRLDLRGAARARRGRPPRAGRARRRPRPRPCGGRDAGARPGRGRPPARAAPRGPDACRAGVRRGGRRGARRRRTRRGRVPRRATRRRAGRLRRRRGRLPRAPNAGCRSRRPPRPRRAASCRASRSRSRPSAAARRSCSTRSTPASAARPRTPSARRCGGSRPRAGRHDHAPAADREPRRPPLPRREGSGRSDAHAHRAARRRRAARGARAHARRRDFLATLRE